MTQSPARTTGVYGPRAPDFFGADFFGADFFGADFFAAAFLATFFDFVVERADFFADDVFRVAAMCSI